MIREWSSRPFETCTSREQDLTFEYMSKMFEEAGLQLGNEQMRSLGLVDDGLYTNLAYILSDQCQIGIRFASYDDESKMIIRGRHEFYGSVLKQFGDVMEYLNMYNPVTTTVDGTPKHKDVRPFPVVALREAILNAIIHRDYSINGPILVSVFDDSIDIVSLGGLNKDLGPDDLILGVSSLRNPKLAGVFYRLHLVESYGTGIPKIMGCYDDSSFKPTIELSSNAFKIKVPRVDNSNSDDEVSVMMLIKSNGEITRKDVEDKLGISRAKANQILLKLVDEKKIVKEGSARSTRYHL